MKHRTFNQTREELTRLYEQATDPEIKKQFAEALAEYYSVNMGPTWLQRTAWITSLITLLFLMAVVVAGIFGHPLPDAGKFPFLAVFAFGCALSTSFLTGDAAVKGQLPFFNDKPLLVSATGGIAVLIIVLLLGYYIWIK